MSDADTAQHPESNLPSRSGWQIFRKHLRQGLRMAAMLRPQAEQLHFSWGQLLALVALNWLLNFAAQVGYVGLDGRFRADAVPDSLFLLPEFLLAWLLACLAATQVSGDKSAHAGGSGRYLIALFALALPVHIAGVFLFLGWSSVLAIPNPWLQWLLAYSPMAWYVLAAILAATRLFQLRGLRAAAGIVVVCVLFVTPQLFMDNDRWLWTPRYSKDSSDQPQKDYLASVREDNIYRQSKLLADTLAQLKPGQAGQVELFFVGAAGYAAQDVFMREVNSISRLFDERFGTAGRSLRLINNADTIQDVPIASKTALEKSFGHIAKLMNPDEDILFLFMTSHGSKEHKFSLDFGMMRFNDLDPPALRQLLDEAGIRRRVIVVSACYSGGFIDALQNDDTLVITAAAADKNSFGCDNENDYTYFGKAYFDEALRKTWSFTEAFELAKPVIAEREKLQEYTPSEPQIALGKNIAPVLEAFARSRERAGK
ncbi:MAG TPA: C13 family peptidase [Rhodocyclaceae bacterium]|nr:C13 family peptidase [Rhodocyclaceae bacterium]